MDQNLNPELQPEGNLHEDTKQDIQPESIPQSETTEDLSLSKTKFTTKNEIVEKIKQLAEGAELPSRQEVESIKQAYYKFYLAEVEAQRVSFVEAGNDEAMFMPAPDDQEATFKNFLKIIKDKRADLIASDEKLREENYIKKIHIIDQIKALAESSDDFNKQYKEFKDLQQKWNEITLVPQSKVKELWKLYQLQTEKFYDLIKINNEFRDYDFKKNLDLKITICESVEKLEEEADPVSAFHQLQNFHDQWREIGPVAKEMRDELWERFKNASTAINKKYQSHFESMKAKESENLLQKTAICDTLKSIDYSTLNSFKEWDEQSKIVIDLQSQWKTIGFVPRKINTQIFEEFRSLCDTFFEKKSEFFKGVKSDMESNLEKKQELCRQAEALKESTEWKSSTDKLIAIQKEWKSIGPVPRKYSDTIWKEFVSACDYFFEQKKKHESSHKSEELENLAAKKEIIQKIKDIDTSVEPSVAIEQVRELSDAWHKIGFVPFKEKDRIYKEFHEAVDAHYDRLKLDKAERRMQSFRSSIKDNLSKLDNPKKQLYKERDHLVYQYNKLKADIQTYENNMSFLSVSSKSSNNLFKDINHKVDDLKRELEIIAKKIEAVDESLKDVQ